MRQPCPGYASSLTLSNVTLCDNQATIWGSGRGGGLALEDNADATGTNVLFCSNEVDSDGGGIYVKDTSTVDVAHTDAWDNTPDDYSGMRDPTGTDGDLSAAPGFLTSSFHLSARSPLIDAGDPTLLDPDGSPSEIGAFGGPGADGWDLDGDGYAS